MYFINFFFSFACQWSFLTGKSSFSSGIKYLKEFQSLWASRELSNSLTTFQELCGFARSFKASKCFKYLQTSSSYL